MHLNAQYVIFATRGRAFRINKETKAEFDDAVTQCGIMGVVVFIPTADGTQAEIIFMDELMY